MITDNLNKGNEFRANITMNNDWVSDTCKDNKFSLPWSLLPYIDINIYQPFATVKL